jgi:hypothetical protein
MRDEGHLAWIWIALMIIGFSVSSVSFQLHQLNQTMKQIRYDINSFIATQ